MRKAFAQEHPDKVAEFLSQFAESAAYANENVAEAAQLVEKYIGVKAPIAQKVLPACNIVCIAGEDAAAILPGYLQTLYDLNPAAVGGALPGEDFYWVNEK